MTDTDMTAPDTDTDITSLASLSANVSALRDDADAAAKDEIKARADLIDRIVTAIKPALRAISTRPKIEYRCWWPDNVSTATEATHADWSAIRLDEDSGPKWDYPRANRGSYKGHAYFLCSDGSFVRLDYTGTWSRWQGESDHWEAALTNVASTDAVKDVAAFVARLNEAMKAQLDGKLKGRAEASRERASKLEAIGRLLG